MVAVQEEARLTGLSDEVDFATSPKERRAIVTENLMDFRPLLAMAIKAGRTNYGLVCVSPKTFPRSKRHIGLMIEAFEAFLTAHPEDGAIQGQGEYWLQRPEGT